MLAALIVMVVAWAFEVVWFVWKYRKEVVR